MRLHGNSKLEILKNLHVIYFARRAIQAREVLAATLIILATDESLKMT